MNTGMNGQQAGKHYERLWELWLKDVAEGRQSWPMADGKVNISEFAKLSGISRNTIYKNLNLTPKIKAEIDQVHVDALATATQQLKHPKTENSKQHGSAMGGHSEKYIRREEYDKLKRRCETLEQKLAVLEPAYHDALRDNKELKLELSRYDLQLETGFVVGPY